MENNIVVVPFTRAIQDYLAGQGFTHLYNKGVESDTKPIKDEADINYILVPLKPGDPSFKEKIKSIKIERIKSNDAIDMANGDPFIRFVLEVPLDLFENYLKL